MFRRNLILAVAAGLAFAGGASADSPFLKDATVGDTQLKSIQALTFGPSGELVIGDGAGKQVVVVDTGDVAAKSWEPKEITNLTGELAGRLGMTGKDIAIIKMTVNPVSQTAYIAVRIKSSKKDVLMTVDATGKIGEFALDKVRHARVAIPTPSGTPITAITDVAWAGDRIFVAAQANETFASKIVSIPLPLDAKSNAAVFSTETYHVDHAAWETKAPIRALMPYEENGKKYVVATFTCTPIVKYAIDDFTPGGKAKGTSVIELGNGNTPQDMFVYTKNGKQSILVSTLKNPAYNKSDVGPSPYWAARVDLDILTEVNLVNEKALRRLNNKQQPVTTRAVVANTFSGVAHMDQLDANRALTIRTDDKGSFTLLPIELP